MSHGKLFGYLLSQAMMDKGQLWVWKFSDNWRSLFSNRILKAIGNIDRRLIITLGREQKKCKIYHLISFAGYSKISVSLQ